MPEMTGSQLASLVQWRFTISEQGSSSRYGTYSGEYYKQYLPNGNVFSDTYPPKRISAQLYTIAFNRHNNFK